MATEIEKTRQRITELREEIDSLEQLIQAGEASLPALFSDAKKFGLASENLEALRTRREAVFASWTLGQLLVARLGREQELERAADFEKRRDTLRSEIGKLRVRLSAVEKEGITLGREIAIKDGQAFDYDFLAGQLRRDNKT